MLVRKIGFSTLYYCSWLSTHPYYHEFIVFLIKHMFAIKNTNSSTFLPYDALLSVSSTTSVSIARGSNLNPNQNSLTKRSFLEVLANKYKFLFPPMTLILITLMTRKMLLEKHSLRFIHPVLQPNNMDQIL